MNNRTLFKSRSLTQERLRELLTYDPLTGVFTRRMPAGGKLVGSEAGTVNAITGYVHIVIDYRNYYGHRLAFLWMLGKWPEPEADHENGKQNDNRWVNLREATKAEQAQNVPVKSNNTAGFVGVHKRKSDGRWVAEIMVRRRKHYLGSFDAVEQAGAAYLEAKARLHTFNPTVRGLSAPSQTG